MSTTETRNITADRQLKEAVDNLIKRAADFDCQLRDRIKALINSAQTCGEMAEAYHVTEDDMHVLWYHACMPTLELTVGFCSDGRLTGMEDYETLYQYCYRLLFDPKRFTHEALRLPQPTGPLRTYSLSDFKRCLCATCVITGRGPLD